MSVRDARGWSARGAVLSRLDRFQDALEAFGHAIELDPGNAYHWQAWALTLGQLGRWNEAVDANAR